MNYKTNTPNYKSKNVNNFSDFLDNIDSEKEELKSLKRSIDNNSDSDQKYPKNSKFKFNKVTRKMDDISLDEIDDKIKSIEESHIDVDIFTNITNKPSYKKLISDMRGAIDEYLNTLEETGFDEGNSDHYMALSTAVTEACNTALEL